MKEKSLVQNLSTRKEGKTFDDDKAQIKVEFIIGFGKKENEKCLIGTGFMNVGDTIEIRTSRNQ